MLAIRLGVPGRIGRYTHDVAGLRKEKVGPKMIKILGRWAIPIFTSCFILLLAGGCVAQGGENSPIPPSLAYPTSPQISVTAEDHPFTDFPFTPIDQADPHLKTAVSQDEAVSAAMQSEPLSKLATKAPAILLLRTRRPGRGGICRPGTTGQV